jgi:hypothetical protein
MFARRRVFSVKHLLDIPQNLSLVALVRHAEPQERIGLVLAGSISRGRQAAHAMLGRYRSSALHVNLVKVTRNRIEQPAIALFTLPQGPFRSVTLNRVPNDAFQKWAILASQQAIGRALAQCLRRQLQFLRASQDHCGDFRILPPQMTQSIQKRIERNLKIEDDDIDTACLEPLQSICKLGTEL